MNSASNIFYSKEIFACRFKWQMNCPINIKNCPFENSKFIKDLEFFYRYVRQHYNKQVGDTYLGENAQVTLFSQISLDIECPDHAKYIMVFGGETIFYGIIKYLTTGQIKMNYKVCRLWRRAYRKWKRLLDYPSY